MTHTPSSADLLAAALETAGRGWPVFMLGRSKRPVANCPGCQKGAHDPGTCGHLTCHGFHAASTDPDRVAAIIAAVPRGQLAVRTGSADTASGLLIVDVDPAHGGYASFRQLVDTGMCPPTLLVITGSGGLHAYYVHPGGYIRSRPLPGYPGIDIKADGGYAVLPPSVHHDTGEPYRWAPDAREVEEMPPALVDAVRVEGAAPALPARRQSGPLTTQNGAGGISYPDKLLDAILAKVENTPGGFRRVSLYGAARGVAKMIHAGAITREHGVAKLTDTGRKAEQSERDTRRAIEDGFRAEGLGGSA